MSKLYKCLSCGAISHRKDWNDVAEDEYGGDIISVTDVCNDKNLCCICPKCGEEVNGDMVEHVFDIDKTKNKYPNNILKILRQRCHLDEDDTRRDDELNKLSPNEVLDEVCNWDGLINYASIIKRWIRDIYNIDLDER